jgi:hypothetical protein
VIVGNSGYHLAPETLEHYERIVSDAALCPHYKNGRLLRKIASDWKILFDTNSLHPW